MGKFYLRSYDQTPPGGYPFTQLTGIRKEFPSQPDPFAQARIVSAFRKANNLPKSSVPECLAAVSSQTCWRLKNDPAYCSQQDSDAAGIALNQSSPIIAPCRGCGAPI